MPDDAYGSHPAVQDHGMAEAEHKHEGLLSKTVGLFKVRLGFAGAMAPVVLSMTDLTFSPWLRNLLPISRRTDPYKETAHKGW